ncbi:hypothetical protein FB451DRAFT_116275 [Mycena latifolia]|nr:hypothetical protein FB451DRAFT_116275 [Mycena latifolia]
MCLIAGTVHLVPANLFISEFWLHASLARTLTIQIEITTTLLLLHDIYCHTQRSLQLTNSICQGCGLRCFSSPRLRRGQGPAAQHPLVGTTETQKRTWMLLLLAVRQENMATLVPL